MTSPHPLPPTDRATGTRPIDAAPPRTPLSERHRIHRDRDAVHSVVVALRSCEDPTVEAELRDELVRLHLEWATSISVRYRHRGVDREDLRQVAHLGLLKAAQRFDPMAGHPFVSFCTPTIRGELRRHFRDSGWMVRPPRRVQELQPQLTRATEALVGDLHHEPSDHELADHLRVPLEDVREAQSSTGCFTPSSLDAPIGGDDGNATVVDILVDLDDDQARAEARVVLAPHVRDLTPRDRRIVQLRFFQGLTQREIAQDIGVTQMQVSRLLTRILSQLRTSIGQVNA